MSTPRYGHMVHEYYVTRLREIAAARAERIAALRTRADAERYVETVRRALRRCFPALPGRTPLDARVTCRIERPRYALETVVYASRPDFLVTGNLYLPYGPACARPAVLGLCGHSLEGKGCDAYQAFAQALVGQGFVVFLIDPISQGERRQFYPQDGRPRPSLCQAHNLMGNTQVLVDDFFGTWRVWDAIRGLDYLLSRPEVDRTRVGVTGNSGGGTLTSYVTALDPRLSMAAPSCHISSFLTDLENELPRDAEQNPPGLLGAGLDSVDLLIAHAPRPTLILAQIDDFFDERAARRASKDLKRVHTLLGSRGSAAYFAGPRDHGYHAENREAMVRFFCCHAGLPVPRRQARPAPCPPAELYATPRGETRPLGSRRVFEFTAETAADLARRRRPLEAAALQAAARRVLDLPPVRGVPGHRCLREHQFAVETETGIQALVSVYRNAPYRFHPPRGACTLYVGHTDSGADVESLPRIRALASRTGFVAVDVRGLGLTMAQTCASREFFEPYGSDYLYASTGELLGESYLGRRVFDLLRVMDWLQAHGATRLALVGRGMGSILAAFAALLHPSRPRCRLLHYLPSYELLCRTPLASWPLSALPRGVLCHFDLPDVYQALGKRLSREEPWDGRMRPLRPAPRTRRP